MVDHFRFLRLALHPEKTKFILFSNSPEARASSFNIVLNFNNDNYVQNADLTSNFVRITVDSEVPTIKFLGIYIHPSLNFKYHIDNITLKNFKIFVFFCSGKNYLFQKSSEIDIFCNNSFSFSLRYTGLELLKSTKP